MKKQIFSFATLLSAAFLISCNNDGTDSGSTSDSAANSGTTMDTGMNAGATATANAVSEADRTFMMEAASGGMLEVEAGRMAEQSAKNARVKNFAAMMIQDHTAANNELKALAPGKNVMLPDSMMAKHRQHIDMLKGKTGKDFDKAYISMMVDDHNEDVNKFQVTSNNASDADLKAFATKTLPTLRMHLDSAKAINGMMK